MCQIFLNLILFLPAITCIFWGVNLFCDRKENSISQNIWIACLLFATPCFAIWAITFTGFNDYAVLYKLDIIDVTFSLMFFPTVFLYFRSLTNKAKLTWKQYLLFAPAWFIGGFSLIFYILMGEEQSANYIRDYYNDISFKPGSLQWMQFGINMVLFAIISILQIIMVMIYSTLNLIRYRKRLGDLFSNLSEESLNNNRAILIGLYAILFFGLVSISLWTISNELYHFSKYVFMGSCSIILFFTSYHVSKFKATAENTISDPEELNIPDTSPAELDNIYSKILPQFIELIDEKQIFLQPHLSLNDIAQQISSNRTYLSRLINDKFQCNFHEYINRKRIEYVQKLIIENPQISQEQATEMSGFISTSTFSRTFKKYAKATFSEWRKPLI